MHAVLAALGVVNGSGEMFKENEAILRKILAGESPVEQPKQADGLAAVKRQLVAAGARIAHSPLSK